MKSARLPAPEPGKEDGSPEGEPLPEGARTGVLRWDRERAAPGLTLDGDVGTVDVNSDLTFLGTVEFPEIGTYRLWVRTRDWVAPWKTTNTPGPKRAGSQHLFNWSMTRPPFNSRRKMSMPTTSARDRPTADHNE